MFRCLLNFSSQKVLRKLTNDKFNPYIGLSNIINNRDLSLNLNYSKNFSTCNTNNARLFFDYENAFAFNVLNTGHKDHGNIVIGDVKNELDFNTLLNQNWRETSATEIVKAFKTVKIFCIENTINVSDTRFDSLVDGLMDHCEKLTDTELYELLQTLSEYPSCESYTSHNFHDVWSCLDDICCWKMVDWDIEKMFTFGNVWYQLNLGKLCDYNFSLIDRLTKKADKLTKGQLIHILFYFNICRKRAVDFEYEYALEKHIENMNIDEMAVVAMGYFKTKTKIKIPSIMETMIEKVTKNSKTVHEISLTALLKILRFSKPTKLTPQIFTMLDHLCEEIDRFSDVCCLHIALISTGIQTFHKKSLQRVSEKICSNIRNIQTIRLKDIERLLNVLSMFSFDPITEPDIFKASFEELHREERLKEFVQYPRCLPCALNYLSLRNIYSHELMNKVLDVEYITEVYGKGAKVLPHVLFSLDCSIDIECPEYKGNRLPLHLRYKAAKWLTDFTPTLDQYKKISVAEQLVLDTIDTVKFIVKDEELIFINHVLPHFSRADIILCKDKATGKFVPPRGFENYVLGDVMFPVSDESLEWYAVVVLGWNNTIRDSSLPLGNILMKERQLKKIGYKTVFVIWNEFMRLSKEQRPEYILRQLG